MKEERLGLDEIVEWIDLFSSLYISSQVRLAENFSLTNL